MKNHIRSLVFVLLISIVQALPILTRTVGRGLRATGHHKGDEFEDPDDDSSLLLIRGVVSVILVLLGGVFAGLTIGLMGQDEVYLQVVAESGEPKEQAAAKKVLGLLARGKHWVLVTLLLGNVITNETLPIVLDRLLGGGWPAVVSATAAIVIFGEVIPQSVCVRYGLDLGAFFAPFVLCLMYVLYPLAYPIALLLDYVLGEDHGTVYKKAGLKSLVTLHHHMGVERLNSDEVTIISAVLDLKEKPVSSVMTPIDDVFVLSSDTILNEDMVEKILLTGFNRIPIHAPGEPRNFMGMLLVRILITYDPEDCLPISAFTLATLPETDPDSSCLNILNYFQEGKAHMVVVSETPGEITGAVGVLTLEDVIEELIGEEIVDESDVYVDVHRAIRRQHPAPLLKKPNAAVGFATKGETAKLLPSNRASNPKTTTNAKITIKRGRTDTPEASALRSHSQGDVNYGTANTAAYPRSPRASGVLNAGDGSRDLNKVMDSEASAIQQNLNGRASDESSSAAVLGTSSESHNFRTGTFVENVVNVGGFKKVVIAEQSDDSDSDPSRRSTHSQLSHTYT